MPENKVSNNITSKNLTKITAVLLILYGILPILYLLWFIYYNANLNLRIGVHAFLLPWYMIIVILLLMLSYWFIKSGILLMHNNRGGVWGGFMAVMITFIPGLYPALIFYEHYVEKNFLISTILIVTWLLYNIFLIIGLKVSHKNLKRK